MKKMALAFIAALISTTSSAGCLQVVKEAIANENATTKNNIRLEGELSQILRPGEDSMAYGGEFYNDTHSNVEVFFISESNGYYRTYSALLANAQSCTIVAKQTLREDI